MAKQKLHYTQQELVDKYFPIYFYRKHSDLAVRDILGLNMAPHHSLIIRDWGRLKPINQILMSRGKGKTITSSIFALIMALIWPRLKVVAAAGNAFRGSKQILNEVEKIINCGLSGQADVQYAKNSLLDPRKIIKKDPSYWSIEFKNGSTIYGVPLGASSEGQTVRGPRAHILIIDEAFMIPTKLKQAVLTPYLNVMYDVTKSEDEQMLGNMEIQVSTIDFDFRDFWRNSKFYESVLEGTSNKEAELGDITSADISYFEFNIDDSYYTYKGERKSVWGINYKRMVKQLKLPSTDKNIWMAENKNQPLNLQGSYFSYNDIEKGMNTPLYIRNEVEEQYAEILDICAAPCILGGDTAPSGDNTAFVVLKVGQYNYQDYDVDICRTANLGRPCPMLKHRICTYKKHLVPIHAYEENKMSQRDRVKYIYDIKSRFNLIGIALDKKGGGHELSDLLKDKDYIREVIGPDALPIYDPSMYPDLEGLPILKLYNMTQDMNLQFNSYLKAVISNQILIFPRPLRDRPSNPRILAAAGHIETLVNQVARIKAKPRGTSVSFDIEAVDPHTGRTVSGKKDIYSALLHAAARVKELIDEKLLNEPDITYEEAMPAGFNL